MGLQAWPISWETPHKIDIALARLVQFRIFTQTLVVDGEGYDLGLLELEPVDRHLQQEASNINLIMGRKLFLIFKVVGILNV